MRGGVLNRRWGGRKIFDAHVHVYPDRIADRARTALGAFYGLEIPEKGTFDDYLSACRTAGVSGFLLFSVATTPHQVTAINDFICEQVGKAKAMGFQAVGFATMHPDFSHPEQEMERILAMGLKGIKLHPDIQKFDLLDPRMMALCEMAQGRLIFNFHIGDDRVDHNFSAPDKLARLCDRFPGLIVIASHLGGYRVWEKAEILYGKENLWFDNSSTLSYMDADHAMALTRACGVDRVLFGTDYPLITPERYLSLFEQEDLNPREKEEILYENAVRLLGL